MNSGAAAPPTSSQHTRAPARSTTSRPGLKSLRVAIVGTGMIAAVHRRSALLAGAEIIGVLGSSATRSLQTAERWGVPTGYSELADVELSDADVVHVCTPNATHAPYVEALIAAGKHVICEKPLATSVGDAARMTEAAQQAGVVATVPFVYRYHPMVREMRARIRRGDLGGLNFLHGHYLQDWLQSAGTSNWRVDPKQGGASRAFADIGSHWCDLVEWVSGDRITRLTSQFSIANSERSSDAGSPSQTGSQSLVATEDVATVMFTTERGVPGTVAVSQVAAGRKNRLWLEVDGSSGSAAFDQENPEYLWLGDEEGSRTVVRSPQVGSEEERRLSFLPAGHTQGYGDCFAAFVADTYSAIQGDAPDGLPTFADGLRSAHVVDAVIRSARNPGWVDVGSHEAELIHSSTGQGDVA